MKCGFGKATQRSDEMLKPQSDEPIFLMPHFDSKKRAHHFNEVGKSATVIWWTGECRMYECTDRWAKSICFAYQPHQVKIEWKDKCVFCVRYSKVHRIKMRLNHYSWQWNVRSDVNNEQWQRLHIEWNCKSPCNNSNANQVAQMYMPWILIAAWLFCSYIAAFCHCLFMCHWFRKTPASLLIWTVQRLRSSQVAHLYYQFKRRQSDSVLWRCFARTICKRRAVRAVRAVPHAFRMNDSLMLGICRFSVCDPCMY